MSDAKSPSAMAIAFANPMFRRYTLGSLLSLVGTWIQRVAVGWLAWELTKSHAWVGIVAMADMLPVVFLAPVAGALADRWNRLKVSRRLQVLNMVQATVLALLVLTGLITIELLFLLTLVQGILSATFQPFRHSIVANMVNREELPGAIAINSVSWHGSRFVGPAIAGGIIAFWGVGTAFVVNAVSYIPFIIVLNWITVPDYERTTRALKEIPLEIVNAARYAFSHPVIGPVMLMLFVTSCIGRAVFELLPGFADEEFGRGADGLAWLVSATGFGAMLGGLWFGWKGGIEIAVKMMVSSILLLALGIIALSWMPDFNLALPCLAVAGFGLVVGGIASQSIVQTVVDEGIRGRVMGIYGMLWMGSPGIGAIVIGAISDVTGLRWPYFAGAVIIFGLWLWALGRRKRVAEAMPS